MAITMNDIKHLRALTGAGLADVKKALEEAGGDHDKAIEIIRKRGQAVAAKRSDREAAQGCVLAATEAGFAAVVSVQCETDFVAKNEDFIAMTQSILDKVMAEKPATKEEVLALPLADGRSVQDHITDRSGITGEKMELGHYEYVKDADVVAYIHPGNMLASIVAFNEKTTEEMKKEIAMQVASMDPVAITPEAVPAEVKERELSIARDKAREAGKPENIIDKIAQGSLEKYYKENTLLMQASILDGKKSVEEILKSVSKTLTVTDFKRVNLNQD